MTSMIVLLGFAALWLAYANGANDNFKGVATLFGSGTTSYRRALTWATVTTLLGSVASVFLAQELIHAFSGKGIVSDAVLTETHFPLAVGVGAAATVMLATRFGLPVSTTHALTGALAGAGLMAAGANLDTGVLAKKFALPLLVSPFVAAAVTILLYGLFRGTRRRLGVQADTCLCVGEELTWRPASSSATDITAYAAVQPTVSVATIDECAERYPDVVAGVDASTLLDRAHYLSAGAVSFARGLNDTPKIAALLLVTPALPTATGAVLVAGAIAAGGILSARRVAETMAHRITSMNHGQGFAANVVTSFLVILASRWGMPVSTTHVSCGSLVGLGTLTGQARWKSILGILAAWVTTLPLAALISGIVYLLSRSML